MTEIEKQEKKEPVQAILTCRTLPSPEQEEGIRSFLRSQYVCDGDVEIVLTVEQSSGISGGFLLKVGADVYDWTAAGRIRQLKQKLLRAEHSGVSPVFALLKESVDEFHLEAEKQETGTVLSVADGIAVVSELDDVFYGEIVIFENGVKGMVQDLRLHDVGCILFSGDAEVSAGMSVCRTQKSAGIPASDNYLGRVVNALGEPLDGMGEIVSDEYRPIEKHAPGIVDRQPVNTPLETGILAIDSMFPIGRGQRELVIGDRQTGKTAICVDTILNQKGKDVVCVYVAIGQKASSVAQLAWLLKEKDALSYTVIVSAAASESAPMQYIAPYAGCALAEHFMEEGRDVLIVYDDLSKHAVAYRALSLLLGRSPGREAYPGDVFYLHSRLLERSAHLSDKLGGGSLTALPIVETQAGDVSAYIPTNIISITDGQIFLESSLFFAGQRPAVNIGLSVSRVGGAAQTKTMKKASGTLRLDLAQYREMEVFTQFAGDLDQKTKEQLFYGQGLMQLLKQPQNHPLTQCAQVISLVTATGRIMLKVSPARVKEFQTELLAWFETEQIGLCAEIGAAGTLSDSLCGRIRSAASEFLKSAGNRFA